MALYIVIKKLKFLNEKNVKIKQRAYFFKGYGS